MTSTTRAYLELHIAILLFGLTAILGDLIEISAMAIVLWRVVLAAIIYWFIVPINRVYRLWQDPRSRRVLFRIALVGVVVAIHWICFYGSIKLSNASIALVSIATASFFASIVEPLVNRTQMNLRDVLMGLAIVPAMALVVNGVPSTMYAGIGAGLLAAFLAAVFSTYNKRYVEHVNPIDLSAIEMSSASIFMLLAVPLIHTTVEPLSWIPRGMDWLYLLILVVLCTNVAYILALRALKHISAFTSLLVINLEPVYGIILAYFILQESEELTTSFYLGAAIIILIVFIHGALGYRKKNVDSSISA